MTSPKSNSTLTTKENHLNVTSEDEKAKLRNFLSRSTSCTDGFAQVVICKRLAKMPILFLAKRRQMRQIAAEKAEISTIESQLSIATTSTEPIGNVSTSVDRFYLEEPTETFDQYTEKLEKALINLRNMKKDEYEGTTAEHILRFLENLIYQPKEWISGAKLKLSEMKFPEMAMTVMISYKQNGYLVRGSVFMNSILLYNSLSNFTDHEFDKEGLIRRQAADAGFIEFTCGVLSTASYRESLKKCYLIENADEILFNDDFKNYQKILYICDSALTILYNMANLPELKIHFRECNAINVIAEYTKLSSNTIRMKFIETPENEDKICILKELQDIVSAIRVTSSLLLTLIINEDEDNLLALNTTDVLPLLSGMIQMYNSADQRFYGFSFTELVDGLSKLMVRGRTYKYIDQNLVDILLKYLEDAANQDTSLLECVSNAILNASFDEKVQSFLDSDRAIKIIMSTQNQSTSELVQKNCEAILWTLNRIPHRRLSALNKNCQLQGHVMISYNRSVTAMCLKLRDRLKALNYSVWLDVDNINGGVLESMAEAVENSSIVLICMNEQYKQSYYCRLEAEYATELRKPCIPCLMQPRFRPYGWLGIIKGAKIHVDFATLPFEEAFAILIREIEMIRRDNLTKPSNSFENHHTPTHQRRPSDGFMAPEISNGIAECKTPTSVVPSETKGSNPIVNWNLSTVRQWLESIGLGHFERTLLHMDGKLLWQLYQMKQSAADAYYKFLDKYFDRLQLARMSDILKFDYELDRLFR